MPRFDRTGPDGNGPLTGRGLGNCVDSKGQPTVCPGAKIRSGGAGRGLGLGRGRGPIGRMPRRIVKEK